MSHAVELIRTLMFTRATADKLETATNVLDALYDIKRRKAYPFLTIRRAIKLQESIVKDLKK